MRALSFEVIALLGAAAVVFGLLLDFIKVPTFKRLGIL
jgi:hypothetical protein